jgi:hypothetical protein
MGMLGVRAMEELKEAFRLLYPQDDYEPPAAPTVQEPDRVNQLIEALGDVASQAAELSDLVTAHEHTIEQLQQEIKQLRAAPVQGWRLSNEAFDYQITSYDEEQANTYIKNGWHLIDTLYTTPPAAQRQWAGLTDDDYVEMGISLSLPCWQYKAIEAKLRSKNNG